MNARVYLFNAHLILYPFVMDRAAIGPALGKIISGIYIATAFSEGRRIGMLSSFVEQAAFEPPLITMALARERPILQALEHDRVFGLNVVGQHSHGLVKSFVKTRDDDPFAHHALIENRHNVPQFAEALAFLACKVVNRFEAGDHWLYLAEVIDALVQNDHDRPMIRVRRNGFDY